MERKKGEKENWLDKIVVNKIIGKSIESVFRTKKEKPKTIIQKITAPITGLFQPKPPTIGERLEGLWGVDKKTGKKWFSWKDIEKIIQKEKNPSYQEQIKSYIRNIHNSKK